MTGSLTIVGLGPAGPGLMTAATVDSISHPDLDQRWLRTERHPAATAMIDSAGPTVQTFDHLYDRHETFAEVYASIVDTLVDQVLAGNHILYAVPGSPSVAEHTVELLVADPRLNDSTVTVVPGLSFADLTWTRLGVDPLRDGVTVIDGHRFAQMAAGLVGPVLVAQCDQPWVLSDIKLSIDDPDDELMVTVLQRLGLDDEHIVEIPWNELDRAIDPDHLTSLWIARLPAATARAFAAFDAMVAQLRVECPWDAEQTHDSLRRYLLEETYEVLEAIDGLDPATGVGADHLVEELGDLLYQVFFHATLAAENGWFTVADVATGIHDKLYVRHPHVYGDVTAETSDDVLAAWEANKLAEKGRASVMDGIPEAMPALLLGLKVQKKAASQGVGPSVVGELVDRSETGPSRLDVALAATRQQLTKLADDPSIDAAGDLLFSAIEIARRLDGDPETALRDATRRFRARFRRVETEAQRRGVRVDELDVAAFRSLWRSQ